MLQLRPAQPNTAWSPPRLLLAAAIVAEVAGGAWVLAGEAGRGWARMLLVVLLGLALDAALLVGALEWELPGGRVLAVARSRPGRVYPTVIGILAFAVFGLGRRLLNLRFGATAAGAVAFEVRGGLSGMLSLGERSCPDCPCPLWAVRSGWTFRAARGWPGFWHYRAVYQPFWLSCPMRRLADLLI
jgi:hypothetical protein